MATLCHGFLINVEVWLLLIRGVWLEYSIQLHKEPTLLQHKENLGRMDCYSIII